MKIKLLYIIIFLFFVMDKTYSQQVDTRARVDTLSVVERMSFRSNAVDWFLLTPNIGFEWDIRNTNWNRWSIGLNLRGNWNTSHTYKPGVVYNLSDVKLEFRNYWRARQITHSRAMSKRTNSFHLGKRPTEEHNSYLDKLFSLRRMRVKHPLTTYYRGLYASYGSYSLKFGSEGKEGSALSAGVTYGIIRPLYVYENGGSIDFEAGFSAGAVFTKYDKYVHDRTSDCYHRIGTEDWHIVPFPVITEVKVGLIYRFGDYPSTSKYRYRYDVDQVFADTMNTLYQSLENRHINKTGERTARAERKAFVKDSTAKAKLKEAKLDSIRDVFEKDSIRNVKRLKFVADSLRKDSIRLQKEADKLRKEEEEKAEKAEKEREKELKKDKKKDDEDDQALIVTEERRRRRYV